MNDCLNCQDEEGGICFECKLMAQNEAKEMKTFSILLTAPHSLQRKEIKALSDGQAITCFIKQNGFDHAINNYKASESVMRQSSWEIWRMDGTFEGFAYVQEINI
jgi:hypothetical protein